MIKNKFSYLGVAEAKYIGAPHDYVLITERHQLLDKKTWDKFVEVFTENSDDHDIGWRCEYWGKMMRGACLTYRYHGDDKLYSMLDYAVRELLKVQREDGRFSTYSEEKQFNGWDLWGRKYVLTGMMHFIDICKDDTLKNQILEAICRHADHIVEKIGDGEGQKSILKTSSHWLCLNSCTILEPFIDLYKRTGKKSYLEFAEYIIGLGGCAGGNLMELALLDEIAPFEYPVNKAYEMMSFFEGLLAYYELTGEEKYLDAVSKFVEKINETDVTIIGCSGCTHELFDNSIVKQTEYNEVQMQETCVTVTWMRVLARLHLITGDVKYVDRIEKSAYNALYGSINTKWENGLSIEEGLPIDPFIFDSYSPLYNNRRGLATGGFKRFRTGGYYGCCACIGSAGTAVFPLIGTLKSESGIVINEAFEGVVTTVTPSGKKVTLNSTSDYPVGDKYSLAVFLEEDEKFELLIRIPDWCDEATLTVGDEMRKVYPGYVSIDREWSDGDTVEVDLPHHLKSHYLNGKTAYTYGPLVLARDELKEGKKTDTEFTPSECNAFKFLPSGDGESLRILLECEGEDVLLTDYASCGKYWTNKNAKVSVWLNAK
ncbi:MAG: glycoside hydrolase family 127 protein [Clostridia bacterium]|nr:glycoside hydrolase family 127 protein [Clostridia bacterium]